MRTRIGLLLVCLVIGTSSAFFLSGRTSAPSDGNATAGPDHHPGPFTSKAKVEAFSKSSSPNIQAKVPASQPNPGGESDRSAESGSVYVGPVALDRSLWTRGIRLSQAGKQPGNQETILVEFPVTSGGSRVAVFDSVKALGNSDDSQQWHGHVEGVPQSDVILTRWNGEVYAAVYAGAVGEYEWRRGSDGEIGVYAIDVTSVPACEEGLDHRSLDGDGLTDTANLSAISPADSEDLFPPSSASRVATLVVGYNAQALVAVPDIEAKILTAVAGANTAYANSGIDMELRLAWMGLIDYVYPPSSNFSLALAQLEVTSDGNADLLTDKRAEYGADFASLWLANDVTGGLGNVLTSPNPSKALSVVRAQNTSSTMAHEIGHNQGCRHNRAAYSSTPSSWESDAFGHKFVGNDGKGYGTIMVNSNQILAGEVRLLHFSNPNVTYQGVATGSTNDENAARCVSVHAQDYEAFRATVPTRVTINTAAGSPGTDAQVTLERAFVGQSYELVRSDIPGGTETVLDTLSTDSNGTTSFEDTGVMLDRAFYWWREP